LISQRKEEEEKEEFLEGEEALSAAAKRAPSGLAPGGAVRPVNSLAAMRRRFASRISPSIELPTRSFSPLLLTF
jgi:hypothetical protein